MTPIIERETNIDSLVYTKFLRNGEKIIYDDPKKEHWEVAIDHGLGNTVDDGGYIVPIGKYPYQSIGFKHFTQTCTIRGNREEQRRQTVQTARNILGEDKVTE